MNPDYTPQTPNQQPSSGSFGPGSVYGPPGGSVGLPQKLPEPQNYNDQNSNKTKKIMFILGGLIGIFIIVAVVGVMLSGGDKTKQPVVEDTSGARDLYKEPTALEIENLNNSVSDDITNLSTDTDFPANKLSDENLKL